MQVKSVAHDVLIIYQVVKINYITWITVILIIFNTLIISPIICYNLINI